ncbi:MULTISPECIES: class I SAM-dependent methyltransferase [Streptomyces]|uniref:O-methyltransferase n=1 Tax=Streptomyces TaxID=1883 RepID=UPI0027DD8AED|nr:class I SAM-dependent methyltransferase [Streptomyces sp. B15]
MTDHPCPAVTGTHSTAADGALLTLPLPDEEFTACRRCLGDTCTRAAQHIKDDLSILTQVVHGPAPPAEWPPADPGARIRHRWLIGHQLAFAVWRLIRHTLQELIRTSAPQAAERAARLYDIYTVLFLYTGSCSAARYAATVRADMAAHDPALSGEWHRDHMALPDLLRQARANCPASVLAPLTAAVKRSHHIHMAVAGKLVPSGQSLLQQAGKQAGVQPTEAECDVIDDFFQVRRAPICEKAFITQAIRRLVQVVCDIRSYGLTDLESPPQVAARHRADLDALLGSTIGRFTELADFLMTSSPSLVDLGTHTGGAMTSLTDDTKTVPITPALHRYLVSHTMAPSRVQQDLMDHTHALGTVAEMRIPHEQAALLTLLTKLTAARDIIDIGTFTGYSALALALGSPPDGRVITCDTSTEWTGIAQDAWKQAGVADRIELRLGPALETLRSLPHEPTIDLAFIDADKPSYCDYWEELLPRVRPGGVLLADNVLYSGDAANPDATGNARAIRAFNAHVHNDPRVENVMLPIADGLTLTRKRNDEHLTMKACS